MHAAGEFPGKDLVDHPVDLDPTLAPEGLGRDPDTKMGFAAGPMPGVSDVEMRFVDHLERGRVKSIG